MINESIYPYLQALETIAGFLLAIYLVATTTKIIGKGWLVAFCILASSSGPLFLIVKFFAERASEYEVVRGWHQLSFLPAQFGWPCLILFIFDNWSRSRMNISSSALLFSFKGRIPRSAFWIVGLLILHVGIQLMEPHRLHYLTGAPKTIWIVVIAAWLIVSTWISLALYAKRWHDCGQSGWMSLILLIPFLGQIVALIWLGFFPGAQSKNAFGSNPLEVGEGKLSKSDSLLE